MSDVQGLVDALALDLDRPVGLDDPRFRTLAYSSHVEHFDRVRLLSILQREAPREVIDWLGSLGVREAERPVRVPANADFGMSPRVCVPVRFDRKLLGFLWLIDEPRLSSAQLEESERYAEEIAVALYRARVLGQEARERERELVATVLGRGPGEPERAAAELITGGHLVTAPSYAALVLRAYRGAGEELPDPIRVRLADSAERLRRTLAPHHMLVLAESDEEVVVVLASGSAEETGRRAAALAAAAERCLAGDPAWRALVGAGEECDSPAALATSYRQAHEAVLVAHVLGAAESAVRWAELGAYRTVVGLIGERDAPDRVPAPLKRLLEADEGGTLTRTLERYLDLAGDARAAADALFIHRSSLYPRLHRIEEVAGVDLHSGEDRLEMHLGLRLLRLTGRFPD